MTTLYGIPNCDQVKKARAWLDANRVAYDFHDFKKAGITPALIEVWLRDVDWNALVNRKGTTWRNLNEGIKASVTDAAGATALMLEAPSVIKRPVLHTGDKTHVGFSAELYQQLFKK